MTDKVSDQEVHKCNISGTVFQSPIYCQLSKFSANHNLNVINANFLEIKERLTWRKNSDLQLIFLAVPNLFLSKYSIIKTSNKRYV